MRDFDQERQELHEQREREVGERQFKFGGETFSYVANVPYDVLRRVSSDEPLAGEDFINAIETLVLDMIEDDDGAHKRFLKLATRKKDPITFDDLQMLYRGLVELAFGRPTEASSSSGAGRETTGDTSTENSSTEQAVASAA